MAEEKPVFVFEAEVPAAQRQKFVQETKMQMSRRVLPMEISPESEYLRVGELLKWMDVVTCLSAEKHSGVTMRIPSPRAPSVTVSVDDFKLNNDVRVGELLEVVGVVNRAFNTSMEVGCTVTAQHPQKPETRRQICNAYFTFLSNDENKKPLRLAPVIPETEAEQVTYDLAAERRKVRIGRKNKIIEVSKSIVAGPLSPVSSLSASSLSLKERELGTYQNLVEDYFPNMPLNFYEESRNNKLVMAPSETVTETVQIVLPSHTQHHNTAFGGQIMEWMVECAMISAYRICPRGTPRLAGIDDIHFRLPAFKGDRVYLRTEVNRTFERVVEVGARVEALTVGESEPRHINSAFFTFLFEDDDAIPGRIKPQTPEEERRYHNALARRRLQMDRNIIRQAGTENAVRWSAKNADELILDNVMTLLSLHAQSRAWDRYQEKAEYAGVHLHGGETEGRLCFKVTSEIDAPAGLLYHFLVAPPLRQMWDPVIQKRELVQRIDANNMIQRVFMNATERSPAQELLLLYSTREEMESNGRSIIAMRSVKMDRVPADPTMTRGEIFGGGWILEPVPSNPNACTASYILNGLTISVLSYIATDTVGLTHVVADTIARLQAIVEKAKTPAWVIAQREAFNAKLAEARKTLSAMEYQKKIDREAVEHQRLIVGQLELAVHHLSAMGDIVGGTGVTAGSRWMEMLNARARRLHGKLIQSPRTARPSSPRVARSTLPSNASKSKIDFSDAFAEEEQIW